MRLNASASTSTPMQDFAIFLALVFGFEQDLTPAQIPDGQWKVVVNLCTTQI
jgi:hypothetical protein